MTTSVLQRNLVRPPDIAETAGGVYLYDKAGKSYFDGSGGAAVSCLGHGHPAIIEALRQQADKLAFAHNGFFSNEPAEELAESLIQRAPAGFAGGKVVYHGSGSEAMEAAIKLVRQHFYEKGEVSRTHFIAREMSYHGNTLGALALGGHKGRRAPYQDLLMDVSHIPPCYAYRLQQDGESDSAFGERMANKLEEAILAKGPENVAAFVAEIVGGATQGCTIPATGYFKRIREICDRYGVLFIADEVMCGMGRTGALFASAQEHVCPDLIVNAKGLGAGYQPIASVMATKQVIDPIEQGSGMLGNGHTYMSHPMACAAGLAVILTFERDHLIEHVADNGPRLQQRLNDTFGQHPYVGDIRGRGYFHAMELVQNRDDKTPFDASLKLAMKVKASALEEGLICYPGSGTVDGVVGDHVMIAPPFIATESELDDMVARLSRAVSRAIG